MIVNRTRNTVVAARPRWAKSWGKRLIGLMGAPRLEPDQALVFEKTRSVHTFFMRFAIEVIFCSRNRKVLHVTTLRPWRIGPVVNGGYWMIERSPDAGYPVHPGDRLEW